MCWTEFDYFIERRSVMMKIWKLLLLTHNIIINDNDNDNDNDDQNLLLRCIINIRYEYFNYFDVYD